MGQELFSKEQIETKAKNFLKESIEQDGEIRPALLADLLGEMQARGSSQSIRGAIENMQAAAHGLAKSKGWWEEGKSKTLIECICLMHSELSEAVEEIRNHKPAIYFESGIAGEIVTPENPHFESYAEAGAKPEGWAVELADAFIRIIDACEHEKVSLADAVILKHAYNATRSYRHGGKAI